MSEREGEGCDDRPQEVADSLQLSVPPHLHNHKALWVLQLFQYCANRPHISVWGSIRARWVVGGRVGDYITEQGFLCLSQTGKQNGGTCENRGPEIYGNWIKF